MTYISGTITDSNGPSVLYGEVATALTAAGFTLVDTVTESTRTHKIWQSPTTNVISASWYLDVTYTTTGSGSFGFYASEGYDVGNHLKIRPIYSAQSSTLDPTTFSRYGATGVSFTDTTFFPKGGGGSGYYGIYNLDTIIPTTSFGYWISISANRVIWCNSVEQYFPRYTGLYQPSAEQIAAQPSALFPLVGCGLRGDTTYTPTSQYTPAVALSRLPGATSMSTGGGSSGWAGAAVGGTNPRISQHPVLPGGATGMSPRTAEPFVIYTASGVTGGSAYLGTLIDVYGIPSSSVTRGDTVGVNGVAEPFLLSTTSSGYSVLFRCN